MATNLWEKKKAFDARDNATAEKASGASGGTSGGTTIGTMLGAPKVGDPGYLGPQVFDPKTGTAGHDPTVSMPTTPATPSTPTPAPGSTVPNPFGTAGLWNGYAWVPGPNWNPPDTTPAKPDPKQPDPAGPAPNPTPTPTPAPTPSGPTTPPGGGPTTPADPEQPIDPGGEITPLPGSPSGPVPTTPSTLPTSPERSPEKAALITQLMSKMGQSTNVDGSDPFIRKQADSYSAQEERARRNFLADQAEGNSPYSTGHQRGLERMTAEGVGQRAGQFESQLIQRELQSRRDEIKNAMDSMGSLLSEEEKNGLQRELANLDASLQWAKITNQKDQFAAQLSQEDKHFMAQLGQQDRFKGMDDTFRRMELAQQNAQFTAKLAQEGKIAEMENEFNKARLSQEDKQYLMKLAQDGKFQDMEQAFKRLALSQDNNQFIAKLAQEGELAKMDDLFRRMKLMQEQSQFLDRLGFDVDDRRAYWEWVSRGGKG